MPYFLIEAVAGPEGKPCLLNRHALKRFDKAAGKIKDEIGPKDDMQNDQGATYWVEDSEIEDQERGFGEEDNRVIQYIRDVVELFFASGLE